MKGYRNHMSEYIVENLTKNNEHEWEKFNLNNNYGNIFHTLEWKKVIEESFNIKSICFLIYHRNKVIGICPFFIYSFYGFKGLMPLPHSDNEHILIDKVHHNHFVVEAILEKSEELVKKYHLSFFLINTTSNEIDSILADYGGLPYPIFSRNGRMLLDLDINNTEKIWNYFFSIRGRGRPRQYIRKFMKEHFKINSVQSLNDLTLFYKYYQENLKFKKIKSLPFSYFKKIWETYSHDRLRITLLENQENFFGGLMSIIDHERKIIHLRHLSINRNIPASYHPTYFLIWDAILTASKMGYKRICFGETSFDTKDVGFRIKNKFGCEKEFDYSRLYIHSKIAKIAYFTYQYGNVFRQLR